MEKSDQSLPGMHSSGAELATAVHDLLVRAMLATKSPTECLYVLRVAFSSASLEFGRDITACAEKNAEAFARMTGGASRESAQRALVAAMRAAVPVAATEQFVQSITERAGRIIAKAEQIDSFEVLLTLHMAVRIVTHVFEQRPDYGPELVGRLSSVRRFLDAVELEVALIPEHLMTKGGSA